MSIKTWIFQTKDLERSDWWSGRVGKIDNTAAVLYLSICVLPLVVYVHGRPKLSLETGGWPGVFLLLYGVFVSLAPVTWLWIESSAFLQWSARRYAAAAKDEISTKAALAKLQEERDRFKMNTDHARALWAAVIAIYAGVLLRFTP